MNTQTTLFETENPAFHKGVVIGSKTFTSYKEYETAYVKEWERLHTYARCDLNWCEKDWETRINHPELYR